MASYYELSLLDEVEEGNVESVVQLIKAGADVNDTNKVGETALMIALLNGHVKCVGPLIEAGADLNMFSDEGMTALLTAAWEGHDDSVDKLIKAGADLNLVDDIGVTPLMNAAQAGNVNCVNVLIEAGADVNACDKGFRTALHNAAYYVQYKCIDLLLKAGVDVNIKTDEGITALMIAVADQHEDCKRLQSTDVKYLLPNHDHVKSVQLLLDAGTDVNATGPEESTTLINAAKNGHTECIGLLVEGGADVNQGDHKGKTALHHACDLGRFHCVDALIKAGADVNRTEDDGCTPLMVANNEVCMRLLLGAGAQINREGKSETNAITLTVEFKDRHDEDVLLLIAAGEKIQDNDLEELPEILKSLDVTLSLKHICREAIRNHLLKLDPHQHLFSRIPHLGVPAPLTEFLLYHVSPEVDLMEADRKYGWTLRFPFLVRCRAAAVSGRAETVSCFGPL